jgi:hypothetical protein
MTARTYLSVRDTPKMKAVVKSIPSFTLMTPFWGRRHPTLPTMMITVKLATLRIVKVRRVKIYNYSRKGQKEAKTVQ